MWLCTIFYIFFKFPCLMCYYNKKCVASILISWKKICFSTNQVPFFLLMVIGLCKCKLFTLHLARRLCTLFSPTEKTVYIYRQPAIVFDGCSSKIIQHNFYTPVSYAWRIPCLIAKAEGALIVAPLINSFISRLQHKIKRN